MERKTLYKLDASLKIREWTIYIEVINRDHIVWVRHGLQVGQKQFERFCFKNMDDAITEMNRRYDKQMNRRGYTPEIPIVRPFRPMLAQVYTEKVNLPSKIVIEPKLDGLRCLSSYKWMMSRQGTYFNSVPHIAKALSVLPPDIVVDGELYIHGKSMQQISEYTKRDQMHELSEHIEYHIYDVVDEKLSYIERLELLNELVLMMKLKYEPYYNFQNKFIECPIKPIEANVIELAELSSTFSELTAIRDSYVQLGYEGCIIRNPEMPYELNVRSYGLYKFKPKIRKWFKITDFVPGSGRARLHAVACCVTDDGLHFKCSLSMPDYVKIQILVNKGQYIGKRLLVEFDDYSDDNLPIRLSGKEIA